MCYQLGSGTREATPRSGWHIHVRPGVLSTFPTYFTSDNRADGSTSPRYGLSGRWSLRDDRGNRPCWCVFPLPLLNITWPRSANLNQIYFGSRFFALAGICSELVGFNLTSQFNCQAWLDSVLVRSLPFCSIPLPVGLTDYSDPLLPSVCFKLLTHPSSDVRGDSSTDTQLPLSMLALYRRIAIWERRPVISIALTAVWLTNVAFLIHGAHLFAADMRQCFDPRSPVRDDTGT